MSLILFQEDWQRYPNAIIDTETKNTSWIEKAYMLKDMGVKNHAFMLALHNPALLGVDPHSDSLSLKMMAAIAVECRQNFWYTVRNVWRAPAKAGNNTSPIEANRANLSMWWCFFNHITYILTQPRQTGKSFCTDILMNSLMNFICENTQINLLTKDETLRNENVKRIKEIYEELPDYLNFKTRNDANNTETVTVNRFNNTYLTHVAQASSKRARNTMRGQTSPIVHIDEAPFQVNIDLALGAALPAMGAVCEKAELNDEPYGVIFTTTSGKKDEPSGKYMYNYISDSAVWSERFYDAKNRRELEEMVRKNSRKGALKIYGCFNHRQLGKSDDWVKAQIERSGQTPDEANRDYFCIWTAGTESSPLSLDILEKLTRHKVPECFQQIYPIGSYILRWYLIESVIDKFMRETPVVVGIDTSDAAGGDDISIVGTDVTNGAVIFTGTYNETNIITFAQWLAHLLEKYPNMTMNIERRSSGATILDYLLLFLPQKGIDPFARLFNWVINDPMEHKALYDEVRLPLRRRSEDLYVRAKKYFGFATSGGGQTNRADLYSKTLVNACRRCAHLVRDQYLIDQITGLVIKNGRVDHEDGKHDDLVIGFLLCHWLLTMGKNLNYYGISPAEVLVEHRTQAAVSAEKAYAFYEQQRIRERMQKVYEDMSIESDETILYKLESELRFLDSRRIMEEGEDFSVDSAIEELKKKKKADRSSYGYYSF